MNTFESPIMSNDNEPSISDLEGKRVCAYCGKVLGEFAGGGHTDTICSDCRVKLDNSDPEFIKEIENQFRKTREKMGLDDFILDSCQRMIRIAEDSSLSHQKKLEKLKDDYQMINAQSNVLLTLESTPEQLKKAVEGLNKMIKLREKLLVKDDSK